MLISKTFIKRKNTTIVIAILLVLLGIISMFNLPVAQLPDIAPPVVSVRSNFIGADAQTVEETVNTPIENQINGTPGEMYMESTSASDGSGSINVTFNIGTDPDIAALDVQNRVNLAMPSVPEEVSRTGVTVRKRSNDMLMVMALRSPHDSHDRTFLDNYLEINILPEISRVEGVGDVNAFARKYSMRIWLNPDKMASLGITPAQVIAAVSEQNRQVAAGIVGAPPAPVNQAFEYSLKVSGRLVTPEQFGEIIVANNPENGSAVHLKDIARIAMGSEFYGIDNKVDGKTGTGMAIYLEPGANALATAERVNDRMEELAKSFPADMEYVVPFETTSFVQKSIDEVVETLLIALVLVAFVVFIFLENWRATLIPILVIPISIIGALIFFYLLGFSINTLTLFGFVLAIGIVVDDAIVVVEAVQHHIDVTKLSPLDATYRAMSEVQAPVIAIGIILAAVFVPVAFIPGVSGMLYQQFALTIAFSVLLSAFLALSLTPALCAMLLKPEKFNKRSKGLNRIFYHFNKWFTRRTERYSNGVRWAIKKSPVIIVGLLIMFAVTYYFFLKVPTTFVPQEDMGGLIISVELPDAAATGRTQEVSAKINEMLGKDSAIDHYMAITGINIAGGGAIKPNAATYFVSLSPWDVRYKHGEDMETVVGRLQQRLAGFKNAQIIVIPSPTLRGFGTSSGFSFVLEQRSGTDIQEFNKVLQNFIMKANQRPEIARAYSFFTASTPQYQLTVDREKCKRMGVAVGDVFQTIGAFLGGAYVNDFTRFGRNYRVMLQADSTFRSNVNDLSHFYVSNTQGKMVPLSAVTTTKPTSGPPVINHFNLYRAETISGNAAPGYSSGDAMNALKEVAAETLPSNFGYEWSNISLQEVEAGNKTIMIFMLSIVFVFLLLTALYESWSVPFSVLLAVPVALFGSIIALAITGQQNSVYSQIGLITLIGLAAKNAILIVEFCKDRVDNGMAVIPATLEAVKLRFRPILMTSFAFIFGILPLCVATGAGAASRVNIGFTVLGGMLAATLVGIFSVPVLYVVISRFTLGKQRLTKSAAVVNALANMNKEKEEK